VHLKFWVWSCATWLALSLITNSARAVEIHTLVTKNCQALSGVVVFVDDDAVTLIDLQGHSQLWRRDDITSVVLHNSVDNPLASITLDARLQQHLYNVYLVDDQELAFTGWPIGFIEELVVFFDLFGRTHVLAQDEIDRMLRPRSIPIVYPPHATVGLQFPRDYIECTNLASDTGIPPSRIIGDRIKVSDYFDAFEKRHLELESFRERTFVYAKPFMYDERTRLGLIYMAKRGPLVPGYIHFSTGNPFAFQSFMLLGGAPIPWLPTVDPKVVLWSDLKSHIFHATFLANPVAVPAGTPIYIDGAIPPSTDASYHTEPHFNYLILMGGDFGPWSGSMGTYYPSRYMKAKAQKREVSAMRSGLVFRARAIWDALELRALYFRSRQSGSDGQGLSLESSPSEVEAIANYTLHEDTVRAGATARLFDTDLVLDGVVNYGRHADSNGYELEFRHYQIGSTISREFGHYVRMNVHANYHIESNYFVEEDGSSHDATQQIFDYGGAFEFQF
jgi:hypothetical protein